MSSHLMDTYTRGPGTGLPQFDILNPNPDHISEEDIAHGLAGIFRFNCQSPVRKCVAEHSLEVMFGLAEKTPIVRFWALCHDAPEAYTGDFIRPHKKLLRYALEQVADIENKLLEAISFKFEVRLPTELEERLIKCVDNHCVQRDLETLWDIDNTAAVNTDTYYWKRLWLLAFNYILPQAQQQTRSECTCRSCRCAVVWSKSSTQP